MGNLKVTKKEINKQDLDRAKLKACVEKFATANIMVVGDIILDEFLLCSPERISREAPVMILNYMKSNYVLGGAGNASANIASLDAKVSLLGLVGDDNGRFQLADIAEEAKVNLDCVIDTERPTTIKTRIISTSNSNPDAGTVLKQQTLRVDRQSREPISTEQEAELLGKIKDNASNVDIILLSDYKSGVLSDSLCKSVIDFANSKDIKVVVDTSGDLTKYQGAYILTPNQPDTEAMVGFTIKTDEDLIKAATIVLEKTKADNLLITRGAKGMALFAKKADSLDLQILPAFNKSEVFDVTGAGDTVAGTLSLALAAAAEPIDAAVLGNLAASLVVRKYGTATLNQNELLTIIEDL